MPIYIPEKGDFIVVTFDPQSGHEQKGRRPALVISNSVFNKATGLTIVCPITNTDRNTLVEELRTQYDLLKHPVHKRVVDNILETE